MNAAAWEIPAWRRLAVLAALLPGLLTGCGAGYDVYRRSLVSVLPGVGDPTVRPGRSDLSYLRVTVAHRTSYMALGYLEPTAEGTTEVWYSATGEVLRLRAGSIVGGTGLPVDLLEVQGQPAPDWSRDGGVLSYEMRYSVMPGYRVDHRERRVRSFAVSGEAAGALADLAPDTLRWIIDRPDATDHAALPPARFAARRVGDAWRWVYTEQCLGPTFCLSLQRLPDPPAVATRAAWGRA